jgi:hypothetical protein
METTKFQDMVYGLNLYFKIDFIGGVSMTKGISIIIIACLCLVFGMGVKSYAQLRTNPANLQEQMKSHIEKVKLSNPQKYQEMIQRAGGNVTKCTDCHQEALKGNPPGPKR